MGSLEQDQTSGRRAEVARVVETHAEELGVPIDRVSWERNKGERQHTHPCILVVAAGNQVHRYACDGDWLEDEDGMDLIGPSVIGWFDNTVGPGVGNR